ncbi:DUF2127 domain-containing protein [Pedosphaera parvula]|nr:DUF2127 domain-containing protein [Pedosphaera parvula]
MRSTKGVRTVAIFEGAKGLLVVLVGFGLLGLVHRNVEIAAEHLVRRLHLNPARHLPHIFLEAAGQVHDSNLLLLAAGALAYSTGRFIEAYGLWRQRRWAEWVAVISGAVYLPVEFYELVRRVHWSKVVIVIVNLGIVFYMTRVLIQSRKRAASEIRAQ